MIWQYKSGGCALAHALSSQSVNRYDPSIRMDISISLLVCFACALLVRPVYSQAEEQRERDTCFGKKLQLCISGRTYCISKLATAKIGQRANKRFFLEL